VENELNLLVDGSLIDLCGATLLWRSAEGLAKGPVLLLFNKSLIVYLMCLHWFVYCRRLDIWKRWLTSWMQANRSVQSVWTRWCCRESRLYHRPIRLLTFIWNVGTFRANITGGKKEKIEHAPSALKLALSHNSAWVSNQPFGWIANHPRTRSIPAVIWLPRKQSSMQSLFNLHTRPFLYWSESYIIIKHNYRYWGAIPIPHGTNGFIGKCPFCATPLEDRGFAKLIFQDHLDS
jgi:hypothetical protein